MATISNDHFVPSRAQGISSEGNENTGHALELVIQDSNKEEVATLRVVSVVSEDEAIGWEEASNCDRTRCKYSMLEGTMRACGNWVEVEPPSVEEVGGAQEA